MERRRMEIEGSFRDHSVIREIVKIVSQVAQALSTSASYFYVLPMRLSCRDSLFFGLKKGKLRDNHWWKTLYYILIDCGDGIFVSKNRFRSFYLINY